MAIDAYIDGRTAIMFWFEVLGFTMGKVITDCCYFMIKQNEAKHTGIECWWLTWNAFMQFIHAACNFEISNFRRMQWNLNPQD